MKKILMLAVILAVSGCANTRDPHPISIKATSDGSMDCNQILSEYKANTDAASYKISKNKADDSRDVLLGVLVWPGLADFKNADGIEGNALLERNVYLYQLANGKGCDCTDYPSQSNRYD